METLEQLQEELVDARRDENKALQQAWKVLTINVDDYEIDKRLTTLLMGMLVKAASNDKTKIEVPFTLLGTMIMNRMFIEKKIAELTD